MSKTAHFNALHLNKNWGKLFRWLITNMSEWSISQENNLDTEFMVCYGYGCSCTYTDTSPSCSHTFAAVMNFPGHHVQCTIINKYVLTWQLPTKFIWCLTELMRIGQVMVQWIYREGEDFLCPSFYLLYHLLCATCEEQQVQTMRPGCPDIFCVRKTLCVSSSVKIALDTQNN